MNIGWIINVCILLISIVSVVMDLFTWKIANGWLYSWMAAGVIYSGITCGADSIMGSLIGIGIPILILGVFFYFRMMGAGDIKLFCAIGAWIGAESILMCMLWSFIAAAIMAVIILAVSKNMKERMEHLVKQVEGFAKSGVKTDYGIKQAGKSRMHISIPVLIGVILKLAGVYA